MTSNATTSTLTERYLAAAARAVPEDQRADLRRELTERIGDALDARLEAGATPSEAEYATLAELGDPDALAATYLDRPLQLIGPRTYLTWKRLLTLLLSIVPVCAGFGIALGQAIAGKPVGEVIGETVWLVITVAIHLCFWVTLIFALIDRQGIGPRLADWKPEDLPEQLREEQPNSRHEFVGAVVGTGIAAVVVLAAPFQNLATPVFTATAWSWLRWVVLGFTAAGLLLRVIQLAVGRWTLGLALATVVLNLAGTVLAFKVLTDGTLINPALVTPGGTLALIVGFVIAAIAVWDGVDSVRRAVRARPHSAS